MAEVQITIRAKTMEGRRAADPQVTVTINEVLPFQRPLWTTRAPDFDGSVTVPVPAPEGSNPEWVVTAQFSRYMVMGGVFFFPSAEPQKAIELELTRLPGAWNTRFTPYAALASPGFDALKSVVAVSDDVDLKVPVSPSAPPVGNLLANYDALDFPAQRLGKMALLNLYSVLTEEIDPIGGVCWFSYVKKIVRMDQERFVAEVDGQLFDHVDQIVQGLAGAFAGQGYSTEPAADGKLHWPNIPARYNCPANLTRMITVKKAYEQGNVQLTVSQLGTGEYLLDCDMDEHLNIVAHTADILEHVETGGTSPVLMHEYIVRDSAHQAADGLATVDLGYVLV